jgi:hypothetical protein
MKISKGAFYTGTGLSRARRVARRPALPDDQGAGGDFVLVGVIVVNTSTRIKRLVPTR